MPRRERGVRPLEFELKNKSGCRVDDYRSKETGSEEKKKKEECLNQKKYRHPIPWI